MIRLPEIGMGGLVFLSVIGLVCGILLGTHQPLWIQGLTVVGVWVVAGYGSQDMELAGIPYMFAAVVFTVGCIIGDISWAFQTDAAVFSVDNISNPFKIE